MNEAAPSVSASSFYQRQLQLHKTPSKKFSASPPSWEKLALGALTRGGKTSAHNSNCRDLFAEADAQMIQVYQSRM
jgi:hypothetical protein